MATTVCFDETINTQGDKNSVKLELGCSSFCSEDSIYIGVNDKLG